VARKPGIYGLFEDGEEYSALALQVNRRVSKVSLALVLSVFTGLVMSGTSQGERLGPGTTIGLFAAVVVSGFLYRKTIEGRPKYLMKCQ